MTKQLLSQGAEAKIYFNPETQTVTKNRIPKSYRLPALDKTLRRQRTKSEARTLTKASLLIPAPKPINTQEHIIEMSHIPGLRLSEHLDNLKNKTEIVQTIGKQIALLHNADIIHGDLTTSNMILSEDHQEKRDNAKTTTNLISSLQKTTSTLPWSATNSASEPGEASNLKGGLAKGTTVPLQSEARSGGGDIRAERANVPKLFFIDFGLAFEHRHTEHKAVDLHLIKQALEAKHTEHADELFNNLIDTYKKTATDAENILKRLEQVEKRGRYKKAY